MSGRYLLDTNTVIFFLKGNQTVVDSWMKTAPTDVRISTITLFELYVGATTSTKPHERRHQLHILLKTIETIPFQAVEAEKAANIKADLKSKGQGIGPLDTLIAGSALAHNLILVTNNTDEFNRVQGLRCLDWTKTQS